MMRPFFSYYGAKWRSAVRYPRPIGNLPTIEPFAGSAGYSVRHSVRKARLFDVDEHIVGVWSYLIRVGEKEVRALPDLLPGQSVSDLNLCQEARWLIGFWLNKANPAPCQTMSAWGRRPEHASQFWGPAIRERIARQVAHIREWTIEQADYRSIDVGYEANWFVDPPYSTSAGRYYRSDKVNFDHLAIWCSRLRGNVIVCEQEGADWLPFHPFRSEKTARGNRSMEVVWYGGEA